MSDFLDRLATGPPVILDGPMGTEINRRGYATELPIWSAWALMREPHVVAEIHADYFAAGAEVATSNTFRTHRRSLAKVNLGDRAMELTTLAVELAREARDKHGSGWVAGSISPLEDCYSPDLTPSLDQMEAEHGEITGFLGTAGIDFVQIETMPTIREAVAATRVAAELGVPVFTGLTCSSDATLLSGEPVAEAGPAVLEAGADGLMINCTPVADIQASLVALRSATDRPLGAYGNVGHAEENEGWTATNVVSAAEYAEYARDWIDAGARIVGSCCGTSPAHTAALTDMIARSA